MYPEATISIRSVCYLCQCHSCNCHCQISFVIPLEDKGLCVKQGGIKEFSFDFYLPKRKGKKKKIRKPFSYTT